MTELPLSKGVKLVSTTKMLNFVYWLANYYPDIQTLRDLDSNTIMELVEEFEQQREDFGRDSAVSWQSTVKEMLQGNSSYLEARALLERAK